MFVGYVALALLVALLANHCNRPGIIRFLFLSIILAPVIALILLLI